MSTTADLTAGTVMNSVASLMNDTARSVYTYAAQIPYLNMALNELQEYFELNEVPVVDTVSAVIPVDSGVSSVGFRPSSPITGTPYLPNDLIEPSVLWERTRDVNPYTMMTRLDFLPRYEEGVEINQFLWYTWQSQEIRFLPANADNDIKMDYIRNLFSAAVDETSVLNVINAQSFLQYRTAGLCSQFIGENKSRADELNQFASLSIDRAIGIGTKGRQTIMTRHRPFRAGYKRTTFS